MPSQYRVRCLLLAVAGLAGIVNSQTNGSRVVEPERNSQVVFVCEHGAALSVVAAAYFNKIVQERHLNLRAIARGVAPQKDLSVSARQGLDSEGVPFETRRPQKLSIKDARNARRVVAFDPLPPKYRTAAPVENWTDVPPTATSYARARDAIVLHLRQLIRELESESAQIPNNAEMGPSPSTK